MADIQIYLLLFDQENSNGKDKINKIRNHIVIFDTKLTCQNHCSIIYAVLVCRLVPDIQIIPTPNNLNLNLG